ncbi:MAG: hypothetical protein JWR07_5102 [Nevskia sp.]|nr:hypothetical protein [Nevskia sp.]
MHWTPAQFTEFFSSDEGERFAEEFMKRFSTTPPYYPVSAGKTEICRASPDPLTDAEYAAFLRVINRGLRSNKLSPAKL